MIEVVVFDAYGTLFDVYSVSVLAEHLYPGQGTAISTLWRDKQIEYTRLISLSDPNEITGSRYYQSFWELTKLSLQYTLTRLKLDVDVGKQNQLMDQYAKLTPFAETLGVLTQLKLRGIPTAILSNGSPEMLASAVQSAGITDMLHHVISVDQVKQFKTSPRSYALVFKYFDVQPAQVLFVSSNAWDALGATWFGFKTFWVNRLGVPQETVGPAPSFAGSNLSGVLAILGRT